LTAKEKDNTRNADLMRLQGNTKVPCLLDVLFIVGARLGDIINRRAMAICPISGISFLPVFRVKTPLPVPLWSLSESIRDIQRI
jgi:hypothetical protein